MGLFDRFRAPRETPAKRAEWLDGAIRTAAIQVQGRILQDLRQVKRNFEAAETQPWTESWSVTGAHINDALSRQLPTLWTRGAGLARNNEWAQAYLLGLDDHVLGPNGIVLQSRLTLADGVTADKIANAEHEGAWARWGESADVSGLAWPEVETLALQTLARRGELLWREMRGYGPMGFQIQVLDPTVIDVNLNRDWQGRRIRLGKELDDQGRPVAYWLHATRMGDVASDYATLGNRVRVPADELHHRYLVEEVGQMRGIPWLTVGARRLWLMHDFEEAAAVASSNAAKQVGFFVNPGGADAPAGFADTLVSTVVEQAKAAGKTLSEDEIKVIMAAAEKFHTLNPGQYDTLPQGYDIKWNESRWPNVDAGDYVKQQLRGWTAARGASYVTIGNDLEAVNYSSAQVGIINEREHHKKTQNRLRDWLHREVHRAALPYLVANTRRLAAVRIPEYQAAATWQPRRWAPIDPLKAAQASEVNLRLKLTSRRRLILAAGDDPDEVAAEVATEDALYGPIDPSNIPPAQDEPEQQGKSRLRLAASRGHE